MQEAMNTFNIQGLVKMVKYVLVFTVFIQVYWSIIIFYTIYTGTWNR